MFSIAHFCDSLLIDLILSIDIMHKDKKAVLNQKIELPLQLV